jgi:hypothetical protein
MVSAVTYRSLITELDVGCRGAAQPTENQRSAQAQAASAGGSWIHVPREGTTDRETLSLSR